MLDKIYNWIGIPFKWLNAQIEWIKGFFNDPDSKKPRGTMLMRFGLVYGWVFAYVKLAVKQDAKLPEITYTDIIFLVIIVGLTTVSQVLDLLKAKAGISRKNDTPNV